MKIKQLLMTGIAGMTMLSLAACGNKSATETHHEEATSSKTTKKASHHSARKSSKTETDNASSSSNASSTKTTINGVKNSQTAKSVNSRQEAVMTATDARNLVKEHLGNQMATARENGKDITQPTVDAVDGFNATQNGDNDWTISGSYNGHTYTYHVTPTAIKGN